MVQLQNETTKISATGTQLVAISYDPARVLTKFSKERKISYLMLSDAKSSVIDSFQVRNKTARGRQDGIPHPCTFLIDKSSGKIKAKLPGTVRSRHTPQQLLTAIGG